MDHHSGPRSPHQDGFLILLLLLALFGLVWLLRPFLPGLFLATVLATSTWPLHRRLMERRGLGAGASALLMTSTVFLVVIIPVVYLLTIAGIQGTRGIAAIHHQVVGLDAEAMALYRARLIEILPLPREFLELILSQMGEQLGRMADILKSISLFLFQSLFGNTLAFFSSLFLITFALYFFYRDGPALVYRLKVLSPLPNRYDDFILNRFAGLATTLVLSTVGIALLQGTLLGLAAAVLGLPWFFLAVAGSITSFIPVVGSMLVWAPTALVLLIHDQPWQALGLVLWCALIIGFVGDNLLRPLLIGWLSRLSHVDAGQGEGVLSHTLLTVLSTFGGIMAFGILGLLFGPIIAAMAITVFDIYEMQHGHQLDRS
ncbi:MAG: AI-2E family transporter [Magnetococcales bacterium]|nr:AI-2E family transporter [Magnetococcales bacterium]